MNNHYMEILKEASFTALPGIQNQEIQFKNEKVYTNNILKENIKKTANKFFSKSTSSKIIKMIDEDRLIPVFKSKNVIDYLFRQRKKMKSHALATTYNGKIFLFLDSFYSLLKLSSINENKLAKIILHELVHIVDHETPKEFFNINIKYFIEFYSEFFKVYTSSNKIDNKDIIALIKRIKSSKKRGVINFRNIYLPLFKKLEKSTSLKDSEYVDRYHGLINYLDKFYESFVEKVPSDIWKAGQQAYIKMTGRKNETVGQEFWAPAEIISIISELKPDHPSVSKTISLL